MTSLNTGRNGGGTAYLPGMSRSACLCRYQDGLISVETASPALFGLTTFDPRNPEKPHRIATEVDSPAFFREYFGVVGE